MWDLYLMLGVAAVTIAVPLLLLYLTDKKKQRAFNKRNKNSDDMTDLDHY